MLLKNIEMINKIETLKPYLSRRDLLGYAAARNIRKLTDASKEYSDMQTTLIEKYGSSEIGEDGEPTGRFGLNISSPEFKMFKKDIEPYAIIEHEVTIFKIPYSEVIGKLTGSEILEIDWMLEDSDSPIDE